jgi:tetratricopeptide (TPR) repeat protein
MKLEEKSGISPFEIDQLGRAGALREALNAALQLIRTGEKSNELYYIAAKLTYELGDLQKSEQLVRLLLAADPEQLNGWVLFGKIHHRRGDQARSTYSLIRVEELFPALSKMNLMDGIKETNRSEKTEDGNGGSSSKDSSFDTETFAEICIKQGYFNKALKIYNDLKEKNPNDLEIDRKIDEIRRKMSKNG